MVITGLAFTHSETMYLVEPYNTTIITAITIVIIMVWIPWRPSALRWSGERGGAL